LCLFSACSRRLWGENHLLTMKLSRIGTFMNHVRWGLGGLQESLPADLADDAHGLLVL
jgi:hypothetical protein